MSIKLKYGEHDLRKPACLEYCYIDPEFCPLYQNPVGESGRTSPAKLTIKRWSDYQENSQYEIDYSQKLEPADQLPKLKLSDDTLPTKPTLSDYADIPDYEQKVAKEHDEFTPFSCWGDGSGFERDIMPENFAGPGGLMESLYDLSYYPLNTTPLQLSDWNTWVDKFQIDNRFAQVSDLNAETILFPNVEAPWMFTEYVFKGIGTGEVIVEPPLYDEDTLELTNADLALDDEDEEILAKYADTISKAFTDAQGEVANRKFVKSYRRICHWDAFSSDENNRSLARYSVPDAGGETLSSRYPRTVRKVGRAWQHPTEHHQYGCSCGLDGYNQNGCQN